MIAARQSAANKDGTAAAEFAMLLPVLITLFFGVVETSMALLCRADISIMASTAADLISQANILSKADLQNVYDAAGTVLYPYYDPSKTGSAKPTIRLTSIVYDTVSKSTTAGKVAWTCTQSGSGTLTPATRSIDTTVTLPQALMTTGGSVIIAEIAYNYSSPTTKMVAATINFTNNFYTKPRRVLQIGTPTGGCP
jgi:Flp pilus assembly protein TadG